MGNNCYLRAELVKQGKTVKELSKHVGISYTHLIEKLNGKYDFKKKEIDSVLEFTGKKYEEIFLTN